MRTVKAGLWLGMAWFVAPVPAAEGAPGKNVAPLASASTSTNHPAPAAPQKSSAGASSAPAPKPSTPVAKPAAPPPVVGPPAPPPTARPPLPPPPLVPLKPAKPDPVAKTTSVKAKPPQAPPPIAVPPAPPPPLAPNPPPAAPSSATAARAPKAAPGRPVVAARSASDQLLRRPGASASSESDTWGGAESAELKAFREADRELFRVGVAPAAPSGFPSELPGPLADPSQPTVRSTGLPPSPFLPGAPLEAGRDWGWLQNLAQLDMPVRWDARVVRYLGYYKDEPRGRNLMQAWFRKSGRYGTTIRRVLRDRGLPDDLVWVALIESGFEPAIRSSAGAAGLWQLMPEGARAFGLTVDRWMDERLDTERSTEAAARYLADLHRRLGSWELALAAYNMGYGALLNAIRKYNTNDFWELTKIEAGVPYETALYVPKIIALAVAARNAAAFGLDSVKIDPPVTFDPVVIPASTSLKAIAQAASVPVNTIESLNPQIRRGTTPPLSASSEITAWTVRVPPGKGLAVGRKFAPPLGKDKASPGEAVPSESGSPYPVEVAALDPDSHGPEELPRHAASPSPFPSSSAMSPPTSVIPDPALSPPTAAAEKSKSAPVLVGPDDKPVVVHPLDPPHFPGRTRIFYRIAAGDTLASLAATFRVTIDDLARWNPLDASARLQEGMTLQIYVKDGFDLSKIDHLSETDVRCLTVGSDDFFSYFESLRGRKRTTIVVEEGETWERLAKRFNLTLGQLERINQRSRSEKLAAKETLVVYAPVGKSVAHETEALGSAPAALGPVVAPNPEDLPEFPEIPEMETSDSASDDAIGPQEQSRRLTR